MKSLTTIQVSPEEDREIALLKEELGLPSKKDVVREGLRALRQILQNRERQKRLQATSRAVREGSKIINREWALHSSALKIR